MSSKNKNYFCKYVKSQGNVLIFLNLTHQRVVPEFIFSINKMMKELGTKDIVLDFDNAGYAYAHPITTIAGIIYWLKTKNDISFTIKSSFPFYHNLGIIAPYSPASEPEMNSLSKIWTYENSDEVNIIVTKIIKSLRRDLVCQEGVLDVCEWSINEVLDNVIQHADVERGFVMGSINKTSNIINLCVFDYGIGIYNSLSKSVEFKPRNELDAITMAVQEGVTSGSGQGYGLAGLMKIIFDNGGGLTIISGKAGLKYSKLSSNTINYSHIRMFDKQCPSTTVNFFIKTDKQTSVEETVGKHYSNIELESLENCDGEIVYKLSKLTLGTATRKEGIKTRTEIINISRSTCKIVVVDFSEITIIASSFADELIAKLISDIGSCKFHSIFRISNTNSAVRSILDKAIEKRIIEDNKKNVSKISIS